jgi:hypothetical protein
LKLLWEVFLKEVFFVFTDSIFIEESFEDFVGVSGLVSRGNNFSLNGSESPELDSGRSEESTGEEERIVEVKEMSEELSAHGMELFFNYER